MSRSYKKRPFAAICGGSSAKRDKEIAHRSERRTVAKAIHNARLYDYEDFTCPLRRECSHNNVYDWSRDGNQRYCGLSADDWNRWCEANFFVDSLWYADKHYLSWPPEWYKKMMRK